MNRLTKQQQKQIYIDKQSGMTHKELMDKYNKPSGSITYALDRAKIMMANGDTELLELMSKAQLNIKIQRGINQKMVQPTNALIRDISLKQAIIDQLDIEPFNLKETRPRIDIGLLPNGFRTGVINFGDSQLESKEDLKWFEKWIENVRNEAIKFDKIIILNGGDMIEGNSKISQIQQGMKATHQTAYMGQVLINLHDALIIDKGIDNVVSYMVAGNHDRVQSNKDKNPDGDSFAFIMYEMIKMRHPELNIKYDDFVLEFRVNGKKCLMTHGDKVGGIGNSINWVKAREDQLNKRYDYTFIYHSHNATVLDRKGTDRKIIFAPSIKPYKNVSNWEEGANQRSSIGFQVIEIEKDYEIIKTISIK